MVRVKDDWLKSELKILNSESKRKYQFYIAGIPTTYSLMALENKGGGVSTVSDSVKKGEMYSLIRAINEYKRKEKSEPFEKGT